MKVTGEQIVRQWRRLRWRFGRHWYYLISVTKYNTLLDRRKRWRAPRQAAAQLFAATFFRRFRWVVQRRRRRRWRNGSIINSIRRCCRRGGIRHVLLYLAIITKAFGFTGIIAIITAATLRSVDDIAARDIVDLFEATNIFGVTQKRYRTSD